MLLFVFLDGVGLGSADAGINPFMVAKTPFLESLLGQKLTADAPKITTAELLFRHLDAQLGFPGLPQSATGQTSLLTGTNAALLMRGHYGPWPGPSLKQELDRGNLFTEVLAKGQGTLLANVYPPGFFRALESAKQKMNVPVYAATRAGLLLRQLPDYLAKKAISVDLTGEHLTRYTSLASISPFEMGVRLATMAQEVSFSFFDYWPSDTVGHRASFAEAVTLIEKLDSFLAGIASARAEVTVLITSDHGNLEDKSIKTHTKAAVPLIVLGKAASAFEEAKDLVDIAPAIRYVLL